MSQRLILQTSDMTREQQTQFAAGLVAKQASFGWQITGITSPANSVTVDYDPITTTPADFILTGILALAALLGIAVLAAQLLGIPSIVPIVEAGVVLGLSALIIIGISRFLR